MIRFYYNTAPNPMKVALCLEEMGLPYEAIPVDTRMGGQFAPEFLALNPNAKTPVLDDGGVVVFDSNAILLHLAEKTGRFLPPAGDAAGRAQMLSWLLFVASGIGPYSGQAVHFKHHAPEPLAYAVTRFQFEAERHWGVLDAQLGRGEWALGDSYSIVDMAVWGWARAAAFVLGADAYAGLANVQRHFAAVSARPAAVRAAAIKDRHAFKTELDADARSFMFRHAKVA